MNGKLREILLGLIITLTLGSYGWAAVIYAWAQESADTKDRAIVKQVEEIKYSINSRLDRQDKRNWEQIQRILNALAELQLDLRR